MATQEQINAAISKYKEEQRQKNLAKVEKLKQEKGVVVVEKKKSSSGGGSYSGTVTPRYTNPPPDYTNGKELVATKELVEEEKPILTAKVTSKGVTYGTKQDVTQQMVTPADSIKTVEDKKGRVVGYEDTQAQQSVSAPEGEYYTKKSVRTVEEERKKATIQNASLAAIATQTQTKVKKDTTQPQIEQIVRQQRAQEFEVLTGKTYNDVKLNTDFSQQIKDAKPAYYDSEKIESVYEKSRNQNMEILGINTGIKVSPIRSENVGTFSKELEESGYYNLASRPTSVTITPKFREEESLRMKGLETQSAISTFYTKKFLERSATVAAIGVGGAYTSLSISSSAMAQKPVIKTALTIGGRALQVGYGYSLASQTSTGISRVAKGDYESALNIGGDVFSQVAGVGLMKKGLTPKYEQGETVIQQTLDKKGYAFERTDTFKYSMGKGKFDKFVQIKGTVLESGKLGYQTTTFNAKLEPLSSTKATLRLVEGTEEGYLRFKGFEQTGKKIKTIELKGEVKQDLGVTKPAFAEGQQRLIQVRGLNADKTAQLKLKSTQVKGVYVEKGLLNKQTPFTKNLLSQTLETKGITGEVKLVGETSIGNTEFKLKGSQLERIAKNVLISQVPLGLYGGSMASTSTQTLKTSNVPSESLSLITTPPSTSLLYPVSYAGNTNFAPDKAKSRENLKISPQTSLSLKALPKMQTRPGQTVFQELIQEQKPRTEGIIMPGLKIGGKKGVADEPDQIIMQKPKQDLVTEQKPVQELKTNQITDTEQLKVPEPEPPEPVVPFVPGPIIPLPGFGFREMPSSSREFSSLRNVKNRYTPSLLGIARGKKATRTTNLSGLEIRGIQSATTKKTKKNRVYDTFKPKKKEKLGTILLKRMNEARF